MANTKQAKKRDRQALKHRALNMSQRSCFRTHLKKVVFAIEANDKPAAELAYSVAVPVIDGLITKGLIHKNKAARHKSRLHKRIQAIAA